MMVRLMETLLEMLPETLVGMMVEMLPDMLPEVLLDTLLASLSALMISDGDSARTGAARAINGIRRTASAAFFIFIEYIIWRLLDVISGCDLIHIISSFIRSSIRSIPLFLE
jgi:hypothetical protein